MMDDDEEDFLEQAKSHLVEDTKIGYGKRYLKYIAGSTEQAVHRTFITTDTMSKCIEKIW